MTQDQGADAPDTTAPGEAAEVAEALDATTIDVEWNDQTWSVPASFGQFDAIQWRTIRRLGRASDGLTEDDLEEAVDFVESILGRAQFRRWAAGDRRGFDAIFDFVTHVIAAMGSTPGE